MKASQVVDELNRQILEHGDFDVCLGHAAPYRTDYSDVRRISLRKESKERNSGIEKFYVIK